ncbi:hypothetical protein NDI52_20870 [Leptolyngbya sp. PL-A3]|uniref:hypothetical protein n=1 Tax=Leptolyngbya sp. PL-A3 TaxID=2933911 RepID=UPI0019952869|nr:hypothetical protein [Leptolyngbya sp. FACHB-16]
MCRSLTGQSVWVGEGRDDLMGLMVHPTEGDRFYSSGHPRQAETWASGSAKIKGKPGN